MRKLKIILLAALAVTLIFGACSGQCSDTLRWEETIVFHANTSYEALQDTATGEIYLRGPSVNDCHGQPPAGFRFTVFSFAMEVRFHWKIGKVFECVWLYCPDGWARYNAIF